MAGDSFAAFVLEQLAPLGRVAPRRMFGMTGLFCEGVMFGMVGGEALFLRVDAGNRAMFEQAGSAPFRYARRGRVVELGYWRAPERLFDEPEELLAWARAALAAARRRARG